MKLLKSFLTGFAVLAIAAAVRPAHADSAKPFRSARLTYIQGEVHVEQARSTAAANAVINMPLVEGCVISAGADGQAEIEFEDGSVVRLTPNSGLSLLNLSADDKGNYQTRMALTGGLGYFELRAGTKFQYTIDAGGDIISPVENATIRVNFDEPPAVVAVLDGTAHMISASGSAVDATAGQTVRSDAASEGGMYMIKQAIATESWDQWNEDRDEKAAAEAGSQTAARSNYAGDQGYGWADLDANGSWYNVPGQGDVWQPNEAAIGDPDDADAGQSAFDPYSYGAWATTPAGYQWASGYGWGWLPYRCGSWSYMNSFGWGWSPAAGCGLYGFGGYGGVNIGNAPGTYRRPHRPITLTGGVHPILHGRGGPTPAVPARALTAYSVTSTKTIGGKTVEPLPQIGGGYTPRGGSALGSALQRDYPVSASTHEPVTGIETSHSAPTYTSDRRAAWQPAAALGANGAAGGRSSGYVGGRQPVYAPRQGYAPPPSSGIRMHTGPQTTVPIQRAAPVQSAPRPAPAQSAPRSAPAPAAPRSAPASAPAASHPSGHR